jgi:membrane protein DedA with SNARE-associated domain
MLKRILGWLSALIIALISTLGYGGVILTMAIESACIPLPSEVIMPFSGFLVASGRFQLIPVALAGAVGCLLGSYLAYWLGATGGRRFIERYGSFLLITHHEICAADRFFAKWGPLAVFLGRLLPAIRTFIALPAGVARMKLWPFTLYTLAGSFLWCFALAYAGMKLGENWETLSPLFHRFQGVIGVVVIFGAAAFLLNRFTALRRRNQRSSTSVSV